MLVAPGIQNAGQTCSAASRILVQRGVYDRVVAAMAGRYDALRVGPALDDLDLGPLISLRQQAIVEGFLARADGLRLAGRGAVVDDAPAGGYYVARDPARRRARPTTSSPARRSSAPSRS